MHLLRANTLAYHTEPVHNTSGFNTPLHTERTSHNGKELSTPTLMHWFISPIGSVWVKIMIVLIMSKQSLKLRPL